MTPSGSTHRSSRRFVNEAARLPTIVAGVAFALLGLAMSADSRSVAGAQRASGIGFMVLGLLFAYRGFVSAVVIVSRDRVVTRSFLRSRTYPMADLVGVRVEVGRTGLNGFNREYLVLELADGSLSRFRELNAPVPGDQAESTVVRRAAEAIAHEAGA